MSVRLPDAENAEYQMEQVVVEKEEEIGSPRDGRVKVAWDSKPAVKVAQDIDFSHDLIVS
eukprot:753404-Hanusia_phi.AAC.10